MIKRVIFELYINKNNELMAVDVLCNRELFVRKAAFQLKKIHKVSDYRYLDGDYSSHIYTLEVSVNNRLAFKNYSISFMYIEMRIISQYSDNTKHLL